MRILIILWVYLGHEAPEAPEGFTREQNGGIWEYHSSSAPDWDTAKAIAKNLAQQPGVREVEIYNVDAWSS